MREPTPDESYCDLSQHEFCTGYTEDELDPETCMCWCHDFDLTDSGRDGTAT